MTSALTLWWDASILGQQGLRFVMRLGVGVRFPTGSIWATMQIADNSSLVSQRTSEIGGQGYDSDRRASYFLK